MAKHLSVSLHRSISLGSPCATEEGKPQEPLTAKRVTTETGLKP